VAGLSSRVFPFVIFVISGELLAPVTSLSSQQRRLCVSAYQIQVREGHAGGCRSESQFHCTAAATERPLRQRRPNSGWLSTSAASTVLASLSTALQVPEGALLLR
jgi:hypothetical protein